MWQLPWVALSYVAIIFWLCALNYILIVLQLAAVTEERNKLRNGANFKNVESLDASKNVNTVQVTTPLISLSFKLSCFLLMFFCLLHG